MKKIIFILLALSVVTAVGYSQDPIKRRKKEKTEQPQSSEANRKREAEAKRQREAEAKRQREAEAKRQQTGVVNGHEWVDLGPPSGLKWATCNVGASNPSDYGDYFAWGETTPKSSYDWENCFDCKDSKGKRWGEYKRGGKTQITPTSGHDTARENWGGAWRMPTIAEIGELCNRCTWTWTIKNGHNGYLVTGPNGNSIFLPAAGLHYGTDPYYVGLRGEYWSSSLSSSQSDYAQCLFFNSDPRGTSNNFRRFGQSVRPVTE